MRNFLILFISFLGHSLFAQTGIIRGNVFDDASGGPIISANVIIEGSTLGATTDLDGFFSINNLKAGSKRLLITYLGFDTLVTDIDLRDGEIFFQNFTMKENGINLGVVSVSAARQSARSEVEISKISVTAKEITRLPSIGGEADIAQYLQMIPGIISTGDQGGQIYIRGGSPIQNKILLDGLNIYNPFHSIGFFSVFETDLIRNVDVFTGGFSAERRRAKGLPHQLGPETRRA